LHTSPQVGHGKEEPGIKNPLVTSSLSQNEIRARLPERSQILQYAVLGDKLIAWVVTREGVKGRAQDIAADELRRKITAYLEQIAKADGGDTDGLARELYAILIRPVEQWLDEHSLLCIVPDKVLSHLPYGALVSPESGRFLIERYTLVVSPSTSIFIACTEEARLRNRLRGGSLLSVGNPSFSRQKFPDLPDLPSAGREAEQVASCYNSASLVGPAAREDRIRSAMAGAEVIHFASHYVADEHSPLLSKLLLADAGPGTSPPQSSDGMLQAYEIYGMKLPHARLVVLSACQTGVEQTLRGEGAIGMARSFLAAGAPLVVASLWPVESAPTAELMIKFHNYRRSGNLTSVEALRQAQQDMIRDPDAVRRRPHAWASFVAYGGYEES
jgi:CHAT domain-containing protein